MVRWLGRGTLTIGRTFVSDHSMTATTFLLIGLPASAMCMADYHAPGHG